MSREQLRELDAAGLAEGYRSGELSPVEVTKACLEGIELHNDELSSFCHVDAEGALAAAREAEARFTKGAPLGPLDGVPGTVKDLVTVCGWPTRRGSATTGDPEPDRDDAPAVRRLREAGVVLLGKTTTPEFGWKAVTDNPRGDVARNPWNHLMTPGGSSGGAAAAAAAGLGCLHIGTDGGGSIRIPASFTGIVGLKPTFGRVPAYPPSPFGSVSHLGPMTRTVADAAAMLDVMAGADLADWTSLPTDPQGFAREIDEDLCDLRIAVSPTLGFMKVSSEVRGLFDEAAEIFEELGAHLEVVDPPLGDAMEIFTTHWFAGAANLVSTIRPELRPKLDQGLREVAEAGSGFSGEQIRRSTLERAELATNMQRFFAEFDLLLTPATAIPAFEAGLETPRDSGLSRWVEWAGFSWPFNLTQQPAISVPCGRTSLDLPVGLQLVGRKYSEALLLRAARAFERASPWPLVASPKRGVHDD